MNFPRKIYREKYEEEKWSFGNSWLPEGVNKKEIEKFKMKWLESKVTKFIETQESFSFVFVFETRPH
jgi:hypothetical protein